MKNPWMVRGEQRGSTGHGNVSEKRVAKSLHAQSVAGSGNQKGNKGDARLTLQGKKWRLESKATSDESFKLQMGHLVKISTEALEHGEVPALTFSFTTPEGRARPKGDWVAIPLHIFRELTEP